MQRFTYGMVIGLLLLGVPAAMADDDSKGGWHYDSGLQFTSADDRFAIGVAGEVVHVDLLGISTPSLSGVFEITYQFVLIHVHADDWIAVPPKQSLDPLDEAILSITVWMRFSGQPFNIGP